MGSRLGPGPIVLSCCALAGDTVINEANEELGRLEHIVLDVVGGRVVYAVLGRGGVFGIGERLFAIPWNAFRLDASRNCMVLDVPRERLDAAPGFDRDHWPAMADAQWAADIHRHYEVRP